jgi:hypothetical protein
MTTSSKITRSDPPGITAGGGPTPNYLIRWALKKGPPKGRNGLLPTLWEPRQPYIDSLCMLVCPNTDDTNYVLLILAKYGMWRSYDRPMPGTIFRLPDITSLQRGITYTILPDGRSIRVPAMTRLTVRANAESHRGKEGDDIMQAAGKKPVDGRARFNRRGQARGNQVQDRPDIRAHGDGVRPARVEPGGGGPAEM